MTPNPVAPENPRHTERRAPWGSRLERQLVPMLALVPLALAALPGQSALLRVVWVLFAVTLGSAFGALTDRRRRTQKIMGTTFALSVVAFGVLAGLSLRESVAPDLGPGPADASVIAAAPTAGPGAPPVSSEVRGKTTTAETELAACQDALRAVARTVAPFVSPSTTTLPVPAPADRPLTERRDDCNAVLAHIDDVVRRLGGVDR